MGGHASGGSRRVNPRHGARGPDPDPAAPMLIETVRGVGYRFRDREKCSLDSSPKCPPTLD